MSKKLTASQFINISHRYGKDKFYKFKLITIAGRNPMKNIQLAGMIDWLDKTCEEPYYISTVRCYKTYRRYITTYFMTENDRNIFIISFGDLLT